MLARTHQPEPARATGSADSWLCSAGFGLSGCLMTDVGGLYCSDIYGHPSAPWESHSNRRRVQLAAYMITSYSVARLYSCNTRVEGAGASCNYNINTYNSIYPGILFYIRGLMDSEYSCSFCDRRIGLKEHNRIDYSRVG